VTSWFDDVNVDALVWLVHPVRQYRRWARRRHPRPWPGAYHPAV